MNVLPVNEVFATIQGEGRWSGTAAVFVRLMGCDVGCPWCDTKHTWHVKPELAVGTDHILADRPAGKAGDSEKFCWINPGHLADLVAAHRIPHVVITGGEPCMHDLVDFTQALKAKRIFVQIETSGTYAIKATEHVWITLSPKFAMPGGRVVLDECLARAQEVKMPVGKDEDLSMLIALRDRMKDLQMRGGIADHQKSHFDAVRLNQFYVQPLSQSPKATALCVEACQQHDFKLSLQMHKYLGVR